MNPIALFFTRLKALLREPSSLFVLALCMVISLLAGRYTELKRVGLLTLALINEDSGEMGKRLTFMLEDEENLKIVTTDVETARRLLMQNRVQCTARIPENFSEQLKSREYRDLIELTVSADSTYSATVTEPLVSGVMKLWFEQRALYNAENYLNKQGLELGSDRLLALQEKMSHIWHEGSRVHIEKVILSSPQDVQTTKQSSPVLTWYSALIPFYLTLSCGWMQQQSYFSLVKRIRRSGFPLVLLFLTQSAASLLVALTGFILTGLLGGATKLLPELFPHLIIYSLGCLGMSLVLCSSCRNYSTLLLIAPTFTLSAAALSGLLLKLPEWASVWEIISNILPGRSFNGAISGSPKIAVAVLQSILWLLIGLIFARIFAENKKRYTIT